MWSRREFLISGGAALLGPYLSPAGKPDSLVSREDGDFIRELAKATIRSATKPETAKDVGFPLITPGGNYPAYWIRDFSMAAGCGLIPVDTIINHLRLAARVQNGASERDLKSGGIVPPFAIPVHITLDGHAVFYPGTYSYGEDQGGEPWGELPPIDDHYEFIHLAYLASRERPAILHDDIGGMTLFERLRKALDSPKTDPA